MFLAGGGGLLAIAATLTAVSLTASQPSEVATQRDAYDASRDIKAEQLVAGVLYAGAALSVASGIVVLLTPSPRAASTVTKLRAGATTNGAFLGYGASF